MSEALAIMEPEAVQPAPEVEPQPNDPTGEYYLIDQKIEEIKAEKAANGKTFDIRIKRLENRKAAVTADILTGQKTLPFI